MACESMELTFEDKYALDIADLLEKSTELVGSYGFGTFDDALIESNKHGLVQGYLYKQGSRLAMQGRITKQLSDESTFESSCIHSDEIGNAIKIAFDSLSPSEALREIGKFWEHSENNCRLAEARSRILLRRVTIPKTKDNPLPPIDADSLVANVDRSSLNTVNRIFSSIDNDSAPKPDLEISDNGNITLSWKCATRKIFVEVEPTNLPWPGLKARYMLLSDERPMLRIFYNAMELLNQLHQDWAV